MKVVKIILALIAFLFCVRLYITNKKFPILKAFGTKNSSNAWLKTTIYDYYLQTLAFAVIIWNTETPVVALVWILLNCILGSPVAIIYLITKVGWRLK